MVDDQDSICSVADSGDADSPWAADWFDKAHLWIRSTLDRLEIGGIGEVEPVRFRPWSAVLRVPTERGTLYFKENALTQRHEAALVLHLARRHPDCILEPLAVDVAARRMLLPDGGALLNEAPHDLTSWHRTLTRYASLQTDEADCVGEHLEIGVPDRRLATLPEQFAELIEEAGPPMSGWDQAKFEAMCAELAGYPIPATLQHGDLTYLNIFLVEGGPRFFDWGDSSVTHPFFGMGITLHSAATDASLREDDDAIIRLRDAYLEPFTKYATRAEVTSAFSLASRVGDAVFALAWRAMWTFSGDGAKEWREFLAKMARQIIERRPG